MLNEIDLSRTDLNLLVLFEAVLQERHVGRAADRLSLSPSAVSHGLGRLRRILNDPLFVRTPKGVVPTDRAITLASPVADALARVRSVLETAKPFDPATSTRRFTIGAPDGVSAVFLPALLAELRERAPGIDLGVRQLLPLAGEALLERAWRGVFTDLEARAIDLAVIPCDEIPVRFHRTMLFEEDFILAMRAGHPYAEDPTLDRYCAMQHLVVSLAADPYGFVDEVLARQGRTRRVALTVPNFMFALSVLAETNLIAALPRRFAQVHATRFGLIEVDAPLPLGSFRLNAVAPGAAMTDAGLIWLFGLVGEAKGNGASRE
jgi:DNA-binding transcriptional LysR family regulator